MLKVLKNLKQSFWNVVIVVILLVVQAYADLKLPDYTSRIVNTGIQASGIENAVPKIISKEQMEMLLELTDEDDIILDNYMINGSVLTVNQEETIKKYLGENANPEVESIYILENLKKEQETEFSKIIATPLTKASIILTQKDFNEMPEEQKALALEKIDSQVSQMQDSIKEQTATQVVKQLYTNLGIDVNKIQNNYIMVEGLEMSDRCLR